AAISRAVFDGEGLCQRRREFVLWCLAALQGSHGAPRFRSRSQLLAVARAEQHAWEADDRVRPQVRIEEAGRSRVARRGGFKYRRSALLHLRARPLSGSTNPAVVSAPVLLPAGQTFLFSAAQQLCSSPGSCLVVPSASQ